MREEFLTDRCIYYRTNEIIKGRKNLLFVHGLSGSSSAWVDFEEAFGNRYNVYSLDLRGHGKSFKPKKFSEYALGRFAEDIQGLIVELNIDNPILICHSFGTLVVFEYLRMHLSLVQAVILLSPSDNAYAGIMPKLLKPMLRVARALSLFRYSDIRGSHIDYKIHPQKSDWDLRAVLKDVKNTSMRVYTYSTEQSLRAQYDGGFLKNINIPVLLVQGRKDRIFPVENAFSIARQIPRSQVVVIEEGDHVIVKNNAHEVIVAIEKFITSLDDIGGKIS